MIIRAWAGIFKPNVFHTATTSVGYNTVPKYHIDAFKTPIWEQAIKY